MKHEMTQPRSIVDPWRCSCGLEFGLSAAAEKHLKDEAMKRIKEKADQHQDRMEFLSCWRTAWECADKWGITKGAAVAWLRRRPDTIKERDPLEDNSSETAPNQWRAK